VAEAQRAEQAHAAGRRGCARRRACAGAEARRARPDVAQPAAKVSAAPAPIALAPRPDADAQPAVDVDQLRGFTTEDIESFKALGVEVLLHSETYGDVWLVPAYTGRDRKEITPEHAATLARVMSVFPGSHIVSFEKTAKTNNPERRERPLEERS
jgi:hypothetical protein